MFYKGQYPDFITFDIRSYRELEKFLSKDQINFVSDMLRLALKKVK